MNYCKFSVETFWSQHLTCEFSNGSYQCVNVGVNHDSKGHQNAKGKVIPGDFESYFQPESYLPVWEDSIRSQMRDIDRELGNASRRAPGCSREAYMMEIHHDTTIRFFDTLGSASGILSHATCFCCLMQSPEHALRGGVRGIVELEVLRAIQNQIGDRIPIQAFFDLIMGTSIPFLRHLITLKLTSKYSTGPFRETLIHNFGEDHLFGNYGERSSYVNTKVAVTATDKTGSKAIIIANYSRKEDEKSSLRPAEYEFLRPDRFEIGLSIADAAAATSAAPTFFKPFEHVDTHRTYLDGAIYHNNPVRLMNHERKLIWPDVADRAPDLFLSIGTSQNKADPRVEQPDVTMTDEDRTRRPTFHMMPQIVTQMRNLMDNILDAEQAWDKFCSDMAPTRDDALRYVRINPDIERQPPKLDEVKKVGELIRDTRKALKTSANRAQIARVTHILVASTFYFELLDSPVSINDGTFSCLGHIRCRFENDSPLLTGLGDFFAKRQTSTFQSYFEIQSDLDSPFTQIPLPLETISEMRQLLYFRLPVCNIRAKRKDSQIDISLHIRSRDLAPAKYHISGFPRAVMRDNEPQSE
ncbi:unnamed protein product [Alternaria alternata]